MRSDDAGSTAAVRVVVSGEGVDAELAFVYPDGPVLPRPDKEIEAKKAQSKKGKGAPEAEKLTE